MAALIGVFVPVNDSICPRCNTDPRTVQYAFMDPQYQWLTGVWTPGKPPSVL